MTVVGDMSLSGVFRVAMIEAETSPDQLLADSEQWIYDVEARRSPDPDDAKAIWDKTVVERD